MNLNAELLRMVMDTLPRRCAWSLRPHLRLAPTPDFGCADLAQSLLNLARHPDAVVRLTVIRQHHADMIRQAVARIVAASRHYGIDLSAAARRIGVTVLHLRSEWKGD